MKRNKARLACYCRAGLIALLSLALTVWAWIPGAGGLLRGSLAAFITLGQYALEDFIHSYGTQAAVVSFFLMILQAIVAPLPVFVIMLVNTSLLGAFWGGVLSWSNVMAGTAPCFLIACILSHSMIEKLIGKTVLNSMDAFVGRCDKHTILVCRLLPPVPFDPVGYTAGLTSIRFHHFFIATGIRQLPATVIYSWVGGLLTGDAFWFVTGLLILFALSVVISVARSPYLERRRKKSWDLPPSLAVEISCATAYYV